MSAPKLTLNKSTWTNRLNEKLTTEARASGDRRYRHAKIDAAQAKAIRSLLEAGFTQAAAAEAFGISQPQVSRLFNNQQWKTVDQNKSS